MYALGRIDNDTPTACRHQMRRAPGWKAPFAPPKAIGALSIQSTRWEFENQMPGRRFPAPWSSEEHSGYFVVRDGNGQAIAYIYYENQAGRRPAKQLAAKLLTKDEARRIAANIAKLPELVGKF